MQRTRSMVITTVATLAAITVGSVVATSPAAAGEAAVPTPVTSTLVPNQTTPSMPPGGTGGTVAQASSGYTGGVKKGDDGSWIAYVEDPSGFVQMEVGRYESKREARKAAKEAAKEWNGVKADPACNDPIVVC